MQKTLLFLKLFATIAIMQEKTCWRNILSGSLLIAGTTIGAGMLGIPSLTIKTGFFPAILITFLVWLFMLATGLLFLEVTLWMHKDANVLSMAERFLGKGGKIIAGGNFLFLYYCLMIAYTSAGAPLFADIFQLPIEPQGIFSYAIFSLIFLAVVAVGLKFIDRVNYILMAGLFISYGALLVVGVKDISLEKLSFQYWPSLFISAPVLFSAFGYHNVIPSLTFHFKENVKVMRKAIFWGTIIPLIVYILWQWVIIGTIPKELIEQSLAAGEPITKSLQMLTGKTWIKQSGIFFSFFALVTSLLGVAFSMVDFLGDGLKWERTGKKRLLLSILTFLPPFIFASIDPSIFIAAITLAGGFGEAFLNGILPAWLVWQGRYKEKLTGQYQLFGGKVMLGIILALALSVMAIEIIFLI